MSRGTVALALVVVLSTGAIAGYRHVRSAKAEDVVLASAAALTRCLDDALPELSAPSEVLVEKLAALPENARPLARCTGSLRAARRSVSAFRRAEPGEASPTRGALSAFLDKDLDATALDLVGATRERLVDGRAALAAAHPKLAPPPQKPSPEPPPSRVVLTLSGAEDERFAKLEARAFGGGKQQIFVTLGRPNKKGLAGYLLTSSDGFATLTTTPISGVAPRYGAPLPTSQVVDDGTRIVRVLDAQPEIDPLGTLTRGLAIELDANGRVTSSKPLASPLPPPTPCAPRPPLASPFALVACGLAPPIAIDPPREHLLPILDADGLPRATIPVPAGFDGASLASLSAASTTRGILVAYALGHRIFSQRERVASPDLVAAPDARGVPDGAAAFAGVETDEVVFSRSGCADSGCVTRIEITNVR